MDGRLGWQRMGKSHGHPSHDVSGLEAREAGVDWTNASLKIYRFARKARRGQPW